KGLPQLCQRISTYQSSQNEPVRLERAADLDERAWKVVDELERERRDDEIKGTVPKRQHLFVGRHGPAFIAWTICAGSPRQCTGTRARGDAPPDLTTPNQLAPHGITLGSEVHCKIEPPQHRRKAIGQILRYVFQEERRRR